MHFVDIYKWSDVDKIMICELSEGYKDYLFNRSLSTFLTAYRELRIEQRKGQVGGMQLINQSPNSA